MTRDIAFAIVLVGVYLAALAGLIWVTLDWYRDPLRPRGRR